MKKYLLIFSLAFLINTAKSQVNLSLGLAAYYPFSGNAGDSSGNGNHPSFNNAILTTDRFGAVNKAYSFDGINSYIKIPNSTSLDITGSFSIGAWIMPTLYNTDLQGIVWRGNSAPGYDPYVFMLNTNQLAVRSDYESTVNQTGYSAGNNFLNKWSYVVGIYDVPNKKLKLYIDGILVNENTFTNAGVGYSTSGFWNNIGTIEDVYGRFKGKIDEVRIYNRILTNDEIINLSAFTTPVTLTSFTAQKKQNNIALNWTNSNETNHAAYELQRSVTANEFTTIATVKGTGATKYDYTDVNAANIKASSISYRLKMISKDGEVTYSKTILVPLKNIDKNIITTIYPNPFKDRLDVGVSMATTEKISIAIIDMNGKQLYNKQYTAQQGFSTISITDVEALSKGMYTLQIITSKGSFTKQIIKAD